MSERGFFIVFEGPDKSGKTTQAKLLEEYLKRNGYKAILTREPGGTSISEKIRDLILDPKNIISPMCELLLYEASRADHVENLIKPALNDGYIVISDRFTIASLVYQGFARGLGVDLVEKLNRIATAGLKIDIIFGFDISVDEYYKRSMIFPKDRMEDEDRIFISKVIDAYRQIYKKNRRIKVIDATKSIDEIHLLIVKEVEKKLL
ncbi:MAG: dTMP kinase [Elusimicrobiales bacterium]